ncbi:MAG: hypothetical protein MR356_04755, partial [Agathobacter sp.]|nr:hypothetical protein [Agathobacter sp.]
MESPRPRGKPPVPVESPRPRGKASVPVEMPRPHKHFGNLSDNNFRKNHKNYWKCFQSYFVKNTHNNCKNDQKHLHTIVKMCRITGKTEKRIENVSKRCYDSHKETFSKISNVPYLSIFQFVLGGIKMKKKLVSAVLATALVATMFAGCG